MLRWSLEGIITMHHEVCKRCYDNMSGSGCFYYCEPCRCTAHNKCAAMVDIDDHDDDEMIGEASKADHPINHNVQAQQITNEDLHKQIEHFSHQHLLTLISGHHEVMKYDDDDGTLNCDACMRPISPTDAFYRCMQQQQEEQRNCHFFLHTNCARLPTKMRHRFHPEHPVTLLSKAPSIDGVFKCNICNTFSQGFVYNCKQCSFYLDLQCNFLPDSLKHEAHDHRLTLQRGLTHCAGCGCLPDLRFSCIYLRECMFSIYCIKCVRLPVVARHKYDNPPLKLTYGTDDVGDVGYYCEICEGERDPEYWFSRCEDCDFDFHPDCVLGRYPQIKLGSTYKHDAHPHPVTLVDKIKSVILNDKRNKDVSPCEGCYETLRRIGV